MDSVGQIHGSILAFAYAQGILYPPDTASQGTSKPVVAAFGPAPRVCLKQ